MFWDSAGMALKGFLDDTGSGVMNVIMRWRYVAQLSMNVKQLGLHIAVWILMAECFSCCFDVNDSWTFPG